jgi:hypothetical protein
LQTWPSSHASSRGFIVNALHPIVQASPPGGGHDLRAIGCRALGALHFDAQADLLEERLSLLVAWRDAAIFTVRVLVTGKEALIDIETSGIAERSQARSTDAEFSFSAGQAGVRRDAEASVFAGITRVAVRVTAALDLVLDARNLVFGAAMLMASSHAWSRQADLWYHLAWASALAVEMQAAPHSASSHPATHVSMSRQESLPVPV